MSELFEYIRSINDNRTIGMIKAFRWQNTIFISWAKFNEDKETKQFNAELMRAIVDQRFDLWLNGCESSKKVPVEITNQIKRFVKRCETYYKDADTFKVFGGGYADATYSRLNKIHKKKFWRPNLTLQED